MKKILFLIFSFLIFNNAYAVEAISEYSNDSLTILNNELRKLDSDTRNLSSSKITEPSSEEQGDILYYDGDSWEVLHHGTLGDYLKSGGNAANPSWATFPTALSHTVVYTSDGNFTAPTGVSLVFVTMCGGGGGGGGGVNASKQGGGGSSGAVKFKVPYAVTPTSTYAVDVGAGGAGGTTNNSGTAGSPSTFDTSGVTVEGGNGGSCASPGTGGIAVGGTVDATGRTTDGDISIAGNAGADASSPNGGCGASGLFGTGGAGGTDGNSGSNASGYGAGGGGAGDATASGGNGSAGIVIIEYY